MGSFLDTIRQGKAFYKNSIITHGLSNRMARSTQMRFVSAMNAGGTIWWMFVGSHYAQFEWFKCLRKKMNIFVQHACTLSINDPGHNPKPNHEKYNKH